MTTIVASVKHRSMAADSKCTVGDLSFPSVKIYRINGALVGAAGDGAQCHSFLGWLRNQTRKRPDLDDFEALVLNEDGLFYYERDCIPNPVRRDYHAIGSGAGPALAALICGKTLKRAVEIACEVDSQSGGPVEVIGLDENNNND